MAVFVHPMAICESDTVGDDTRIWAFAHVMRGARVGCRCNIGEGVFVETGAVLGDRVTLKNQVLVWDGVQIGDDVFVGPGVIFTNDAAPRSPRMAAVESRYQDPARWRRGTTVDQGASLGAGAVILPGLAIGAFALVGAGSVVTRSVAPYRVVVGNPARAIGWACQCGYKLNAALRCPECETPYALTAEGALVKGQNPAT